MSDGLMSDAMMSDGSMSDETRGGALPFVSVVLPIRNEVDYIDECLERLLTQDYPPESYEILVVDGDSEDGTQARVEAIQERVGTHRLRLLRNPDRIVPSALNVGIREAVGDIIVRMDGHTVPAVDYVSACVQALRNSRAANAGGPMIPAGETSFGKAVAAALQHPAGVGGAKFHFGDEGGFVDTVYMGAFRKEIFETSGMFDESMVRNQDYEMNVRIRKAGGKIYLDPRIRSTYTPRSRPGQLWRQYFQYGWWRVETLRRHPDSLRWRQVLPVVFVAMLLALGLAAPFASYAAYALGVLSGVYLLTLLLIALSLVPRLGKSVAARIPLALATMHVSWGLGFLASLASGGKFPYRASPPAVPALSGRGQSRPSILSRPAATPSVRR